MLNGEDPKPRPTDGQVGGDHYKAMKISPWEALEVWLTEDELRGYHKGNALVYLARERAKGGDEDIAKARHHLQELGRLIAEGMRPKKTVAGWSVWRGIGPNAMNPLGVMPVEMGAVIDILLRDGSDRLGVIADSLGWAHSGSASDIVGWRRSW